MASAPGRWQLIELKRTREAVRGGIDLLDRKREALVRELLERRGTAEERRRQLQLALDVARRHLDRAFDDIGRPACQAAALAQTSPASLEVRDVSILGVRLPHVEMRLAPFQISYGPGGTSSSLDEAARAFGALIPQIVELASFETAVRNLQRALQRTTRTLNALKDVLLPELETDIRAVAAGLEEEERDERARWVHRDARGASSRRFDPLTGSASEARTR